MQNQQAIVLLTTKATCSRSGLSRTGLYRKLNEGRFPQPAKIGNLNYWGEHEVNEINRAVLAGKTDEEIKKIVRKIEAARVAVEV